MKCCTEIEQQGFSPRPNLQAASACAGQLSQNRAAMVEHLGETVQHLTIFSHCFVSHRKCLQNVKLDPVDLACYMYTTLRLKSYTLKYTQNYSLVNIFLPSSNFYFIFFPLHSLTLFTIVASSTQLMHMNRMIKLPYCISCLTMETSKGSLLCLLCLQVCN